MDQKFVIYVILRIRSLLYLLSDLTSFLPWTLGLYYFRLHHHHTLVRA